MVSAAQEESGVNLGQLKCFTINQLRIATENFSSRNEIGRGGFGKVYKGVLSDGTFVAVKRLKEDHSVGNEQQFRTEVRFRPAWFDKVSRSRLDFRHTRKVVRTIFYCLTS